MRRDRVAFGIHQSQAIRASEIQFAGERHASRDWLIRAGNAERVADFQRDIQIGGRRGTFRG